MRAAVIRKILLFLICCIPLYLIILFWSHDKPAVTNFKYPIVLWWTSLLPNYYQTKQCGVYKCTFTVDRNFIQDDNTKAILFYGSDLAISDLPLPRKPHHIWGLFHEESPKNTPFLQYEESLKHFNLSSTFSRYSSLPLTSHFFKNLEAITSRKYLVPIGEKNKLRKKGNLAPIAFIQSICDTMSGRDEYVRELMQYIEIDSYGKCLHNKDLPESLSNDYLRTIESNELYKFLARYKFVIAYENGVCNDYITEKFWRPLLIGTVPIYYGSPTIRNWLPNKKSAILIEDFDNPKQLAMFVRNLDRNDQEYNKYLDHKYSVLEPITNKFLIKTFEDKDYYGESMFEHFECFVCKQLYKKKLFQVDQSHYDCGEYPRFPQMNTKVDSTDWEAILKNAKCQSSTLDYFLKKNYNFTMTEFDAELLRRMQNGICDV